LIIAIVLLVMTPILSGVLALPFFIFGQPSAYIASRLIQNLYGPLLLIIVMSILSIILRSVFMVRTRDKRAYRSVLNNCNEIKRTLFRQDAYIQMHMIYAYGSLNNLSFLFAKYLIMINSLISPICASRLALRGRFITCYEGALNEKAHITHKQLDHYYITYRKLFRNRL
jgi:hypothetical protein